MDIAARLHRPIRLERWPDGRRAFGIKASPELLPMLAAWLDVAAVLSLGAEGELGRAGEAPEIRLSGRLEARLLQACVVTMEPVEMAVETAFDRWFSLAPEVPGGCVVVSAEEADMEPLEGERVDVALVVLEELSLALDPFPRSPGADAVLARYTPEGAQ